MIQYLYDLGVSNYIYKGFIALGLVSELFFGCWYGKKYGIPLWKSLVSMIVVYIPALLSFYVLFWIESGFTSFGGMNTVRGIVYLPLFIYPVAKILKLPIRKMFDFFAPCACINHGVAHIGCIYSGCCYGYPTPFGVWNPKKQDILFPVQAFECLTLAVIVIFFVYLSRRSNFKATGYHFPIMLALFGSTRFLWEFARDNEKILWGCSSLAFHALFMAIVGIISLIVLYKKNKQSLKPKSE